MTEKIQLDIPLVQPELTDASDACVRRLMADLDGRSGLEKVHVLGGQGSTPARLCVHHDPNLLSLARIREIVQASGATITERFGHVLWSVDGIVHERRARTIEKHLRAIPGVLEAEASASGVVRIELLVGAPGFDGTVSAGIRPV